MQAFVRMWGRATGLVAHFNWQQTDTALLIIKLGEEQNFILWASQSYFTSEIVFICCCISGLYADI